MIEFSQEVVINRPVGEVFEFLSDSGNESQWQAGLIESKHTSEGPAGVGTTGRDVRKFMGRKIVTTWEVTEWEPNQMFGFKVITGPMPFVGSFAVAPVDGGTRLTAEARAEAKGLTKLFAPLVSRLGTRQYKRDFAKLKEVLEARV